MYIAIARKSLIHCLDNRIVTGSPEHRIDFRNLLQDFVFIALRQTSCDHECFQIPFFISCHLKDRINALFFGVMNETACVDDDHIRLFLVVR